MKTNDLRKTSPKRKKSVIVENHQLLILEVLVTLLWLYMVLHWVYYPSTLITLGYLWALVWVAVKRPRWLPTVLIVAFPLEVSKMFIPAYSLPERVAGFNVSILDFFRLSQVAITLRWLSDVWQGHKGHLASTLMKDKFKVWRRIKTDALLWLPITLLGVYLLSTAFSIAPGHSFVETVRLASLIFTLYLAVTYIQDERDLQRLGYTLIAVGAVLGLIAIGEYLMNSFFFSATPAVVINRRL